MKTETYNIGLECNQILKLVRQLPDKEKIRLLKELEKETIDVKLTSLLKPSKLTSLSRQQLTEKLKL